MLRKTRSGIFLLLVAVTLLLSLWYTAPRTAEELFSDFQWNAITDISGSYDRYEENDHPAKAPVWVRGRIDSLSPASETGQTVLNLMQKVEYRRSLKNLIPISGHTYGSLHSDDLVVTVIFHTEGTPGYFSVEYYYDRWIIKTGESREYTCSATGEQDLAQEILALLQPHAVEEIP